MTLSRRSFLGVAGAAAGCAVLGGLVGCGAGASTGGAGADGADSTATAATWSATQDDSLDVLTMQVAGGNVVAMTGDGWAARDGWIQLQLSGASIPGQTIESISEKGGTLTVKLEASDGIQTMDLLLTEWRLEGGDVSGISRVTIEYSLGDVREAQQSYD